MVSTLDIKRNSLSSRWGVWASESEEKAPVENLLGEFKTRGEAEAFREFVSAGQTPQAALVALKQKAQAEKGGGKSIFGKLLKRGDAPAEAAVSAGKRPSNPVIEIQKHEVPVEAAADVVETRSEPPVTEERQARASSIKYEVIEPARKPRSPRPEAQANSAEASYSPPAPMTLVTPISEEAETREEAPEAQEWTSASQPEPVEQEQVSAEVAEEGVAGPEREPEPAPDYKSVRMVSRLKARDILSKPEDDDDEPVKAKQEQSEGRRGLLNWTFTPPPDVSAAEVGKRPQAVPEPEPEEAEEPVAVLEPAPQAVAPVETAPPQEPEQAAEPVVMSVTPAAVPAAPAGDVRQAVTAQPVPSSSNGKVTIDICTARSLQNEAWGDPGISDKKYSSIASKEYTEISKAMAAGGSPEHLREELVHLASVCIAWADAIDKRLASQEENAA